MPLEGERLINDATILRFYFEGAPPRLSPAFLQEVVRRLADYFELAVDLVGLPAQVEFYLVAPPRAGCLEIHLQVVVETDVSIEEVQAESESRGVNWNAVAAAATSVAAIAALGQLLWSVVYAPGGIFDLHANRDRAAEIQAEQLPPSLAKTIPYDDRAVRLARELAKDAREFGIVRLEIQLPDSAAVIVFDRSERTRDATDVVGPYVRINASPVRVRYGGKVYYAAPVTALFPAADHPRDYIGLWDVSEYLSGDVLASTERIRGEDVVVLAGPNIFARDMPWPVIVIHRKKEL